MEPGVVRFVTSFTTTSSDVDGLISTVRRVTSTLALRDTRTT
ncbi:hypothetical protein [Arthrobacter sp. CAN_C5]|nr:hypothetical protein [Arthrobacter sp. CAN_C5]MBP2217022.1 threonine aldolase [Arthrobacter sp. CAN_C5]